MIKTYDTSGLAPSGGGTGSGTTVAPTTGKGSNTLLWVAGIVALGLIVWKFVIPMFNKKDEQTEAPIAEE